jgi:hypothetical protein
LNANISIIFRVEQIYLNQQFLQLSSDPFIKQVSHADFIVNVLLPEDNDRQTDVVLKRLRAQLSHSDGIRGFMVTYLTSSAETEENATAIPKALMTVMKEIISSGEELIQKRDDLISLACMNVIMPTGMVTMHDDPNLSKQSRATAQNAITLLKALYQECSGDEKQLIQLQLESILQVAKSDFGDKVSVGDNGVVIYWKSFFEKWGYKEQQRIDIATAVEQILA